MNTTQLSPQSLAFKRRESKDTNNSSNENSTSMPQFTTSSPSAMTPISAVPVSRRTLPAPSAIRRTVPATPPSLGLNRANASGTATTTAGGNGGGGGCGGIGGGTAHNPLEDDEIVSNSNSDAFSSPMECGGVSPTRRSNPSSSRRRESSQHSSTASSGTNSTGSWRRHNPYATGSSQDASRLHFLSRRTSEHMSDSVTMDYLRMSTSNHDSPAESPGHQQSFLLPTVDVSENMPKGAGWNYGAYSLEQQQQQQQSDRTPLGTPSIQHTHPANRSNSSYTYDPRSPDASAKSGWDGQQSINTSGGGISTSKSSTKKSQQSGMSTSQLNVAHSNRSSIDAAAMSPTVVSTVLGRRRSSHTSILDKGPLYPPSAHRVSPIDAEIGPPPAVGEVYGGDSEFAAQGMHRVSGAPGAAFGGGGGGGAHYQQQYISEQPTQYVQYEPQQYPSSSDVNGMRTQHQAPHHPHMISGAAAPYPSQGHDGTALFHYSPVYMPVAMAYHGPNEPQTVQYVACASPQTILQPYYAAPQQEQGAGPSPPGIRYVKQPMYPGQIEAAASYHDPTDPNSRYAQRDSYSSNNNNNNNANADSSSSNNNVAATIPVDLETLEDLLLKSATEGEQVCPPGWMFSVYDASISKHYGIPSDEVAVTAGAVKYVEFYQRYGAQTRFRFQVCKRYLNGSCTDDGQCQYIHTHSTNRSTNVHVNDNAPIGTLMSSGRVPYDVVRGGCNNSGYKTLPRGYTFTVYPPNNSNTQPQMIPSQFILQTSGAINAFAVLAGVARWSVRRARNEMEVGNLTMEPPAMTADNAMDYEDDQGEGDVTSYREEDAVTCVGKDGRTRTIRSLPIMDIIRVLGERNGLVPPIAPADLKPRHCAHFQFKRMCHLGESCNFIHSLVPFIQGTAPELQVRVFEELAQQTPWTTRSRDDNTDAETSNFSSGKGRGGRGGAGGYGSASQAQQGQQPRDKYQRSGAGAGDKQQNAHGDRRRRQ